MSRSKNDNLENNRIHIRQSESEVTRFQKREEKHQKKSSYILILLLIWIGLFFGSMFLVVQKDQWNFSLAWEMKYVTYNIQNFYQFVLGNGGADGADITFYQYLIVALTGAALAACGAVFQGSFKNVLAGPSTMGVMSGGTLGCAIYLFLFTTPMTSVVVTTANLQAYYSQSIWQRYQMEFCILIGCFVAVFVVLGVSMIAGKGKVSSSAMVVGGMVFSTIISNITMLIQYYMILKDPEDERIDALRDMMMGSFNKATSLTVLAMMGIPIIICLMILILISGKLNLLSFGEEEALSMGVNVQKYRNLMIIVGTVLTAVVVAFCGHIGFVGFMVPLLARRISGPDMRKLLPASMLTGAILLTVIFDVAYFFGMTDSMNVITSAIGCVVMVVVLMRKGGSRHGADQRAGAPNMGM